GFAVQTCLLGRSAQSACTDFSNQAPVRGYSPTIIMNAHIIYVLDEVAFALLKPRNLLPNEMLYAAFDRPPTQQPACMSLAVHAIRPKRFDFRMLDVAAQNIAQSDDVRSQQFVQTVAACVMRVDTYGMHPSSPVFAEWRE